MTLSTRPPAERRGPPDPGYLGPERRQKPMSHANHSLRGWLAEWVAPPTLLSLIAFGGLTAVAHYRLGVVERDVAEIKLRVEREERLNASIYQRRDVLLEQLNIIDERMKNMNERLRGIEDELKQARVAR